MKRTVLLTIIILTFPALCQGSESPMLSLELPAIQWEAFSLELGTPLMGQSYIDLGSTPSWELHRPTGMVAPNNMISMASFVWAEMTGSVDIVAEVRTFSREWRKKGRPARAANIKRHDSRSRWKIVVGCRIDDNMELAARFDTRGSVLNEKRVAWQLSAADLFPDDVGLTTVYRDGSFLLEAEDVNLTDDATVKVVVRF
jgi:hypothetical protein